MHTNSFNVYTSEEFTAILTTQKLVPCEVQKHLNTRSFSKCFLLFRFKAGSAKSHLLLNTQRIVKRLTVAL